MSELDARKGVVLKAVVRDFVNTNRPVGSDRLIDAFSITWKSATVRNELSDLDDLGFLRQPHVSAGRVPTERGYRYYVDQLMDIPDAVPASEAQTAQRACRRAKAEVDAILLETCRILTRLTSYPAVASNPDTNSTYLRQVFLSLVPPRSVLLVAVFSNGKVEHSMLEQSGPTTAQCVELAARQVNAVVAGKALRQLGLVHLQANSANTPSAVVAQRALEALQGVAASLSRQRVWLEGTNQLLHQPEFRDAERLEALLRILDQHNALYRILAATARPGRLMVSIGKENSHEAMQACSVVCTTYQIGGRTAGYLGVFGPTRLHYDRAAAAVNLMANSLSQALTQVSKSWD
ncbi:MAG: heat-inducible transcription repressor HrcA [Armatimonadetes bacterium]|nr:heat-inducible transcription repressor HrcA [Armatimonadota bacterium]MDE2205657.1 heat-inducible transcription repressor HrcA [Armatimonadota bacterium]